MPRATATRAPGKQNVVRVDAGPEQESRDDQPVNAARMTTQRHDAERAIRRLRSEGLPDASLNPSFATDARGARS